MEITTHIYSNKRKMSCLASLNNTRRGNVQYKLILEDSRPARINQFKKSTIKYYKYGVQERR